jgi:hypothetical protein
MKTRQEVYTPSTGWQVGDKEETLDKPSLVYVFGDTPLLKDVSLLKSIQAKYPTAHLFGCTSSGEIIGNTVNDESIVISAVEFAKTNHSQAVLTISDFNQSSLKLGKALASSIPHGDLTHVMVLSNGLKVNGSDLVKGLVSEFPDRVIITGGLAGDADRFKETGVISGVDFYDDHVAILGFYGNHLKVSYGSMGGWDPFGPERRVTKSQSNVLFELDGESALDLYKRYLGSKAKELPGSALLFPLMLTCKTAEGTEEKVVRTILSVDERNQSMTFAGDVPEGSLAQLMKANFDRLIDGASQAASQSLSSVSGSKPRLGMLISCVGRKMILKQRVEEEVEGVREILGPSTQLTGFYSYGEISPIRGFTKCSLHNQTMTITTYDER